ncbi:unnamed protein product, partial [Didymodactylos carnosus]
EGVDEDANIFIVDGGDVRNEGVFVIVCDVIFDEFFVVDDDDAIVDC